MYLEKSLSCLGNGNRKGDESDEIKKRLSREEVTQVEAGMKGLGDKKMIFIFIQDKDKEEDVQGRSGPSRGWNEKG